MATATLPPLPLAIKTGNIPRQEPIDDGDFWLYRMIPVFKEHERNGVVFDAEAMDEIANESNLRIEDTGDYVPIVLRHNEDDKDSKVVGYAGPFIVGEFGRLNPVACIYAEEFRIQKTDRDEVSRYPRLSVELWAKKDAPNRGYFDPICLLGSETPHLDLGIQRYARKPADAERFRVCYSMDNAMTAAPASTNTFLPAIGNEKREDVDSMDNEPVKYQEGMNGGGLATEDIQQIVAALEETIVTIIGAELDRRGMGGGADAGMGVGDPMAADPLAADPMAAAGGDPLAAAGLNDGPPGADDALPPEMGGGETEPDGDEMPGDGDPTTESPAEDTPGDKKEDKDGDGKPAKYRKEIEDVERVDYRRAYDDMQTKYAKLEAELAIARGEKVKAVRYQRLTALAGEGYLVNADEEIADCEGMTDDQFAKHETRIRTKYAKSRTTLPGTQPETKKPVVPVTDKDERSRLAAIARDNCLKYQKDGKAADYKAELRKVYEQNGKSWDEK